MSAKNPPIGTVECPHKGCSETCSVFKFRERAGDEKLKRFAGKLYAVCPTHGRIGADGATATQEYLLSNAKMKGPPKSGAAGAMPAAQKASPGTNSPKSSATSKSAATMRKSAATSRPDSGAAPEKPPATPWWAPVIR